MIPNFKAVQFAVRSRSDDGEKEGRLDAVGCTDGNNDGEVEFVGLLEASNVGLEDDVIVGSILGNRVGNEDGRELSFIDGMTEG
jgi:hypothetical protein